MGQTVETVAVRIRGETKEWRAATREVVRSARKMGRESARAMNPMDRAVKKTTSDLDRMSQAAKRAAREAQAAATKARRQITRGFSRMKGAITTALGFGGVAGTIYGIRNAQQFEQALVQLQVQGGKTASWLAKAREEILAVSNATGRSKEEVLSYMEAYIAETGDAKSALETLRDMGEVAVATGANMADLAGAMIKVGGAMKVASKDSKALWNIWRQQEKLGSVTLKEFSQYFGRFASLMPAFGKVGTGLRGARAAGALFQIGARSFGQEEHASAATAVARFLQQLQMRLQKNPAQFAAKLGMKVSDFGRIGPKGFEFADLATISRRLGEGLARNPAAMGKYGQELFGRLGVRVARELMLAARRGWSTSSGKYAAASQIFGAGGKDLIGQDVATIRKSKAWQYTQKLTELQNAFYKAMLPVFEKLVEMMPMIVRGLKFALDHIKEIVAVWLGAKLIGALRGISQLIAGLRGGGGAVAGGGFGAITSRMGIYGAAFTAATWAGKKIGELIAGKSVEAVKEEMAEIERAHAQTIVNLRRQNLGIKALNDWLSKGAKFTTAEGAQTAIRAVDLARRIASSGEFEVDRLIAQKGRASGAKALLATLRSRYRELLAAVQKEILSALPKEKRAGAAVAPWTLEKAYPVLGTLHKAADALDRRLAELIQATRAGKSVDLNVSVRVPDPTVPGKRAKLNTIRPLERESGFWSNVDTAVHTAVVQGTWTQSPLATRHLIGR